MRHATQAAFTKGVVVIPKSVPEAAQDVCVLLISLFFALQRLTFVVSEPVLCPGLRPTFPWKWVLVIILPPDPSELAVIILPPDHSELAVIILPPDPSELAVHPFVTGAVPVPSLISLLWVGTNTTLPNRQNQDNPWHIWDVWPHPPDPPTRRQHNPFSTEGSQATFGGKYIVESKSFTHITQYWHTRLWDSRGPRLLRRFPATPCRRQRQPITFFWSRCRFALNLLFRSLFLYWVYWPTQTTDKLPQLPAQTAKDILPPIARENSAQALLTDTRVGSSVSFSPHSHWKLASPHRPPTRSHLGCLNFPHPRPKSELCGFENCFWLFVRELGEAPPVDSSWISFPPTQLPVWSLRPPSKTLKKTRPRTSDSSLSPRN